MVITGQFTTFLLGKSSIELCIPDEQQIQQLYAANKTAAYWARVWPASVGLGVFLAAHPQFVHNKNVLELAAGLGLPGLYAARLAKTVCISDREPLAIDFIERSAAHLQQNNVKAVTLDWNAARALPLPDLVLLSDVNYEPAIFEELKELITFFLHQKVQVIISTPQRLMAKQFIMSLLLYSTTQWSCSVLLYQKETNVSVFVLENSPNRF